MNVDRNDFTVPITRPEPTATPRANQTRGPGQRNTETGSIEGIEGLSGISGISGLEGIESSPTQRNARQQEPENNNEPSMDIEELDQTNNRRQEDDDLMAMVMDEEEERDEEPEEEEEDEDDGLMSMAMGALS
jgi:hypothetical protein